MTGMHELKSVCLGFIGAVMAILCAIYFYNPQRIATVNVNQIIKQFAGELSSQQGLTKQQIQQAVKDFSKQLDNSVQKLATQKNVLQGPAQ